MIILSEISSRLAQGGAKGAEQDLLKGLLTCPNTAAFVGLGLALLAKVDNTKEAYAAAATGAVLTIAVLGTLSIPGVINFTSPITPILRELVLYGGVGFTGGSILHGLYLSAIEKPKKNK